MDYLQPQGFLGTGASLLADLTLMAYVLLIVPGMIAGYVFARRGQHRPLHKYTMITITFANWALIIFLMIAAYRFDVAGNIGSQPGNARYLMPTIHGILGLPAQLLATYVVYRMIREDVQVAAAKKRGEKGQQLSKYWFKNAKVFMRTTIVLWLLTSLLGVFNYLIRYDVIPAFGSGSGQPVVTAEPLATAEPGSTPEVQMPAVTVEPASTPEVAAPAATVEVDDDDNSGPGNSDDDGDNSGPGSGDDDDDNSGSGSGNSGSGSGEAVPAATEESVGY